MSNKPLPHKNKYSYISGIILISWCAFAWAAAPETKGDLTALQKEARVFRAQGLEQQKIGNLDAAMAAYQKAVELDPAYSVVYNDLGVIYEAKGMLERAEQSYEKAVLLDPNFLSTYSNLALLYETKSDVEKACFYWKKRADLGSPTDPWTKKAKERLDALMRLSPSYKKRIIEQEIAELNLKVEQQKKIKKEEVLRKAKEHLELAKKLYSSSEYDKALNEARIAFSLNPQDNSIQDLMKTIKNKLTEQENKAKEEKKKQNIETMRLHFETGVKYYQQDNLQAAKEEFGKVKELTASPLKK